MPNTERLRRLRMLARGYSEQLNMFTKKERQGKLTDNDRRIRHDVVYRLMMTSMRIIYLERGREPPEPSP